VRKALVNAATSRWRRLRARVPEVPLTWGGEPDVAAADHADRLAVADGLIRALRTLPPRQRAVVVLRYLDDLPESEVAAVLGCSVGSVRSQASRGLARLRDSEHLHTLAAARPADLRPTRAGVSSVGGGRADERAPQGRDGGFPAAVERGDGFEPASGEGRAAVTATEDLEGVAARLRASRDALPPVAVGERFAADVRAGARRRRRRGVTAAASALVVVVAVAAPVGLRVGIPK
jgi:hypothetical protein